MLLGRHLCQGQYHPCKHIYRDLLVHRALYPATKDTIPTNKACKKCVILSFFTVIEPPQDEAGKLIDSCELSEVTGVCPSCSEYQFKFLSNGARPEEKYHATGSNEHHWMPRRFRVHDLHKGVRKSNFGAIDGAVAGRFDNS